MKTALVTGATGFVGAHVMRLLLEQGYRVKAFVRPTSDRRNIEGFDVEIVEGDLREEQAVDRAVRGCSHVYHVAAEYSFWSLNPQSLYESNIKGTANVMESCLKHQIERVVYTSTVGTIGMADLPVACDESTPMLLNQLSNHYKRSKFEAEKTVLGYAAQGLPVVIVNPTTPIGSLDRKPTPTGKIIVDFVLGRIPAYLKTGLNIASVRDIARGHLLAAEKGRIGERYILGYQNMSLEEIFELLAEVTGRPRPKIRLPYGIAWMAGLVSTKISDWVTKQPPAIAFEAVKMARKHMYFNSTKAVQELGMPQTPVRKAFEEAVEWFSRQGYFNLGSRVV